MERSRLARTMSHPLRRRVLLCLSACACVLGACSGVKAATQPTESLSVRELNIVDEHGQPRIRIGAPLPNPQGLKRKKPAYGVQFMSPSGQEIGGFAMLDDLGVRGICFDSEEGYEALCMSLMQGQPSITFRQDWQERITLDVAHGEASIVLHDAQGHPKLRLAVDKDGTPHVEGMPPAPAGR